MTNAAPQHMRAFTCDCCLSYRPEGTGYVLIRATWRAKDDQMCQQCWGVLLHAAQKEILQQGTLPL